MAFREIGAAFVRLFVKKDELSAGLKQAEGEVVGSVTRMQHAAEKVSKGPLKSIQSILNSTLGTVVSIVGKVTLISAIITTVVSLLAKAYEWATGIADAAEKAKKNYDSLGESLDNLRERFAADRDPFSAAALSQRIKAARAPFEEAAKAAQEIVAQAGGEQRSLRMFLFGSDEDVAKAKQRYDALSQIVQEYYDSAQQAEKAVRGDFARESSERAEKIRKEEQTRRDAALAADAEIAEAVVRQQEENRLEDWRERERMALDLVNKEYDARMERERELQRLREDSERRLQSLIEQFQGGNVAQDQRVIGTLDRIASNTGRVRR